MKPPDQLHAFGFVWDPNKIEFPVIDTPDTVRSIWRVKKLLAEIIRDTVALEGNPLTAAEIQTLLDGVTVGGRRVSDAAQVLNQRDAILRLVEMVTDGTFALSIDVACTLQGIAARGQTLKDGVFRDGPVSISGTAYRPPSGGNVGSSLKEGFLRMAAAAAELTNPFERGMVVFLHLARTRPFWAGNRLTGQIVMNGVLLGAGQDIIFVPQNRRVQYEGEMLAFYGSGDGTEVMAFLSKLLLRSRFE